MTGSPIIIPNLSATNAPPSSINLLAPVQNPFLNNLVGTDNLHKNKKNKRNPSCDKDEDSAINKSTQNIIINKHQHTIDYFKDILTRLSSLESTCTSLKNENKRLRQEIKTKSINQDFSIYESKIKQLESNFLIKVCCLKIVLNNYPMI